MAAMRQVSGGPLTPIVSGYSPMPTDFLLGLRIGVCLGALGLILFLIVRKRKG